LNFNKYYQSDIEQQYQRETPRQQQPLTPQPEPEPKISLASHYTLPTNQPSSLLSSRFTNNYNAKPRGWGNFGNSDRGNYKIYKTLYAAV